MRALKISAFMLLISFLVFAMASCSASSAVKKATGGAVDVSKEGEVKIKDKEGGEVTIGKAKWDSAKMHGMDAPRAKLDSYISSNDGTSYIFSEMKPDDAKAYIEKIKAAGYTYNYVHMDEWNYTGINKDGLVMTITYSSDTKSGMIVAAKGEKPNEESGTVYEGENAKWDSANIGGLPEPGVKITGFSSYPGGTSYTFEKMDNPKEYADVIKQHGFHLQATEMESDGSYMYIGQNESGEIISFAAGVDICTISFSEAPK